MQSNGDGRYAVVCGLVNVVIYYAVGKLNVTLKQATTTRLDHSRRVSRRRNRRVYKFAAVRAAFRSIVTGGIGYSLALFIFRWRGFGRGGLLLTSLLPYCLTALLPYCLTLLPYSLLTYF
jgi:ABC-type Fe3+ transport system permease subunit